MKDWKGNEEGGKGRGPNVAGNKAETACLIYSCRMHSPPIHVSIYLLDGPKEKHSIGVQEVGSKFYFYTQILFAGAEEKFDKSPFVERINRSLNL